MPRRKADHQKGAKKNGSAGAISRRDVLKIGAAAGAATVIAPTMLTSRKALGVQAVAEPDLVACRATPPVNSPAHTPFADTFTAPFPAIPQDLDPARCVITNYPTCALQ